MGRIDDIAKLKEEMVDYTANLSASMQPLTIVNPDAAVSAGLMGLMGAYIEQMCALNETMAMIYEDIQANKSPYKVSDLRADMIERGATAMELAALGEMVKKYKGE